VRGEYGLGCVENMLSKVFGSKGDEINSQRRRLLNEVLFNLYSSQIFFRVIKLTKRPVPVTAQSTMQV